MVLLVSHWLLTLKSDQATRTYLHAYVRVCVYKHKRLQDALFESNTLLLLRAFSFTFSTWGLVYDLVVLIWRTCLVLLKAKNVPDKAKYVLNAYYAVFF